MYFTNRLPSWTTLIWTVVVTIPKVGLYDYMVFFTTRCTCNTLEAHDSTHVLIAYKPLLVINFIHLGLYFGHLMCYRWIHVYTLGHRRDGACIIMHMAFWITASWQSHVSGEPRETEGKEGGDRGECLGYLTDYYLRLLKSTPMGFCMSYDF